MGEGAVQLSSLHALVTALRADGRRVIGPTVRDGAIVLAELESADELPYGWGVELAPGEYRLRRRDGGDASAQAAFAHAAGPQSWKTYLHPAREQLLSVKRQPTGDLTVSTPTDEAPRYAFLGVRACDLRAIGVQDRVLGRAAYPDSRYAARRDSALLIAVNCTEPGETCFCAAAGCGPGAGPGYDLVLTELVDAAGARYLAEAGTPAGEQLLAAVPHEVADPRQVAAGEAAIAAAGARMERTLPAADLRSLLAGAHDAARWDEVAQRCLTCANCTMVCPTCFCTTVTDTTDLAFEHAQRWREWDSCFDLNYSYLHGGPIRASASSRYRQWLTHKFGTWHDQFGESGCVGCGRCIVWCPVGIDVTEELHALADETAREKVAT
jgi:formate hydrogenlyase subunit 6/NADH:ubiquinone oxidoreductase subunit I